MIIILAKIQFLKYLEFIIYLLIIQLILILWRIAYKHEIDDLNRVINFGNVDDDTFQIYIKYCYEKFKILSGYV